MTPEQEIWNAERARQIMEEPIVKQALDEMERLATDALEQCPINDIAFRDRVWMVFCMTRRFRRQFQTMMETGKLAEFDIKQKRSWADAARKVVGI
jgi:hypothetical protein